MFDFIATNNVVKIEFIDRLLTLSSVVSKRYTYIITLPLILLS